MDQENVKHLVNDQAKRLQLCSLKKMEQKEDTKENPIWKGLKKFKDLDN